MKTINVSKVRATAVHKVAVPYVVTDDETGENETVDVEIRYRGLTLGETQQFGDVDELEGEERTREIARQLAAVVVDIPTLRGDDGEAVTFDEDFFVTLDVILVHAISAAIAEARTPKDPTKTSS